MQIMMLKQTDVVTGLHDFGVSVFTLTSQKRGGFGAISTPTCQKSPKNSLLSRSRIQ